MFSASTDRGVDFRHPNRIFLNPSKAFVKGTLQLAPQPNATPVRRSIPQILRRTIFV